ncbi:olfactory receptor 1G1-like [Engystomops pustulosus]|uniref:olfactory receptor 1G1-like n=1 Tax=Engystomops pustulosus TaxID=76066 RepID=UPI003AFA2B9C
MNQTSISVLLISLSDSQETNYVLFIFFLLIYLMTVFSNSLIILLVVTCAHLHTPMYFFLGNLALMDMSFSSVTAPRLLFSIITQHWSMSLSECITQMFFVLYFVASEAFLLASMSFDRYVAICRPLHYSQIMSWSMCIHFVSFVWSFGFFVTITFTLCLKRLTFCGRKLIQSFFCDLPHLLQISCTDPTINVLILMGVGGILSFVTFVATFYPYVMIFRAVLRIGTSDGKSKAFSTCTSHLTVVLIFYSAATFVYYIPNRSHLLTLNRVFSVNYILITPLLNPLIYSLRSKDLKAALQRALHMHRPHPAPTRN